jgi:cytochrome c oxidase cbb3-type subunit 3
MRGRIRLYSTWMLSALVSTACGGRGAAPGRPTANSQGIAPDGIRDFNVLYSKNCSGCHGADGKGGAAIGIGDPVYLAIADDATIVNVIADGFAGTSMPAFARHSGGMLTDDQIHAIVRGIRVRWGKPNALRGAVPPPYAAPGFGDPKRGATVYGAYCSPCHGADGRGGKRASSIVDGSYLSLVSDQNLRTTVIVGRPELGAPDWRGDIPGKAMSPENVSDVVAWLAFQRPQSSGQSYSGLRTEGGMR